MNRQMSMEDWEIVNAILTDKDATEEDFARCDRILRKYGLERDPNRTHPSVKYVPKRQRRYVA